MFGFAKSDKANLDAEELAEFKKAAKELLEFSQEQVDAKQLQPETGLLRRRQHGRTMRKAIS